MNTKTEGLAGMLTISRRSDERIYIQITDDASRSKFVELEVTPHDFAMALTGLSNVECRLAVNRLSTVGMEKQREKRSVVCPLETYDKQKLIDWILANCAEDGWEIDSYLGHQGSIRRGDSGTVLNYGVFRYVTKGGDQ